jgi:hypothetical protein
MNIQEAREEIAGQLPADIGNVHPFFYFTLW